MKSYSRNSHLPSCSFAIVFVVIILCSQRNFLHGEAPTPTTTGPTTGATIVLSKPEKTKEQQLKVLTDYAKEAGLPRGMASYTTTKDAEDKQYKLVITGARSDRIDVHSITGSSICLTKCEIPYAGTQRVRVCDCKTIRYNANGTLANHRFPPYPGSYFEDDTADSGYPTRGVIWTNNDGWRVIKGAHIIVASVCFRTPCCPASSEKNETCGFNITYVPNWELVGLNRPRPSSTALPKKFNGRSGTLLRYGLPYGTAVLLFWNNVFH